MRAAEFVTEAANSASLAPPAPSGATMQLPPPHSFSVLPCEELLQLLEEVVEVEDEGCTGRTGTSSLLLHMEDAASLPCGRSSGDISDVDVVATSMQSRLANSRRGWREELAELSPARSSPLPGPPEHCATR